MRYGKEWVNEIVIGLNSRNKEDVAMARKKLLNSTYGKYTVNVRVDRYFDIYGCRETEGLYGPGHKRKTRRAMKMAAEEGLVAFVKRYDPSKAPVFKSQSEGTVMMRCAAKDILANIREAVRQEFNEAYGMGLTMTQFKTLTVPKKAGKLGFLNDYTAEELSEATQNLPKSSRRTPERIARLQFILQDLFPGEASNALETIYKCRDDIEYPANMVRSLYEKAAFSYVYDHMDKHLYEVEAKASYFHVKRGVMTKFYYYHRKANIPALKLAVKKAIKKGVIKKDIGDMIIDVRSGKRQIKSYADEYGVTATCIGVWIKNSCKKLHDMDPGLKVIKPVNHAPKRKAA